MFSLGVQLSGDDYLNKVPSKTIDDLILLKSTAEAVRKSKMELEQKKGKGGGRLKRGRGR